MHCHLRSRKGDKQNLMNKLDKQMGLSVSPKWDSQRITAYMTRLLMSNNTIFSFHSPPFFFFLCFFSVHPPPPCFFAFPTLPLCHPLSNSLSPLYPLHLLYPTSHFFFLLSFLPSFFFFFFSQIIASLEEDPAAQSKQLALRLQQIAAALENKVTDL